MPIESYFFDKLAHAIKRWPDDIKWSLQQLASYTTYDVEEVSEWIGSALGRKITSDEKISKEEGEQALKILREAHEKEKIDNQELTVKKIESIQEKLRVYASQQKWTQAYQTVSYFLGNNRSILNFEQETTLINDCLHYGIKCGRSVQELFPRFLDQLKNIQKNESKTNVADLLDMIDAYGGYFIQSENGKKQINELLNCLNSSVTKFSLHEKWKALRKEMLPSD